MKDEKMERREEEVEVDISMRTEGEEDLRKNLKERPEGED